MIAIFPELIAIAKRRDFEKLAVGVRTYFLNQRGQQPRVQLHDLIESIGVHLEHAPLAQLGALVVKDDHGKFSANVFIRKEISDETENFMLAHMLGHMFLHVMPKVADGDWKTGGFKEVIDPRARYIGAAKAKAAKDQELEIEADFFAAALLLPSGMIKRAFTALKSVEKTAEFFDVDAKITQRRLEVLGLIEGKAHKTSEISAPERKRGLDRIREIAKNLEK